MTDLCEYKLADALAGGDYDGVVGDI